MLLNPEYLDEDDNFEFYAIQEIGFSHKKLAKNNNLYANFDKNVTSTYYQIIHNDYLKTNEIYQVWVIDKKLNIPIGLSMAVVFHPEEQDILLDDSEHNSGIVLGQIHCFINKDYRGFGLAKKTIPILENFLYKKCPSSHIPCILMKDQAYSLAKHTKKCCILPYDKIKDSQYIYQNFINGLSRFENYNNIKIEAIENVEKSNENHPQLLEIHKKSSLQF